MYILFTYTLACAKKNAFLRTQLCVKFLLFQEFLLFGANCAIFFCFRAFFRIGGAVCLGTVWFAEFAWRVSRKDAKMVVWQSGMSKGIQHDLKGCNCRLYRSQDAGIFLVVQITNPVDEALAGHVSSPTLVEIAKSP